MWDFVEEELKYKTIYRDFNSMQYTELIIPLPAISRTVSL